MAAEPRALYQVEAPASPMLTVGDAAKLLNQHGIPWSKDTLYRLMRAGHVPFGFRLDATKGEWHVHRAEVLAFAEQGRLPWLAAQARHAPATLELGPLLDDLIAVLQGLRARGRKVA